MLLSLDLLALRSLALVLLGSAPSLLLFAQRARARAALARHRAELERDLGFLRLRLAPNLLIGAQASMFGLSFVALALRSYLLASLLATFALSPRPWLSYQRSRRTTAIEAQLDGWLFGLAATLRAVPAPGKAIAHSALLVAIPLREELETLVKEQTLGASLESALARMSARIGSRTLESALATLRIGQASGGDIPHILERSAATLRELGRLEGVVRTKTAESKAQAWLLALLPFPLVALLHWLDPAFLAPLLRGVRGALVIAGAVVLWLASIVAARRILDVDI